MYIHLKSTIQAKLSAEELDRLATTLGIPDLTLQNDLGEHWWPNRGLGEVPPKDPVIYRLYESVLVYGHAIKVRSICILFYEEGYENCRVAKAVIHEKVTSVT
jgi:cyanate lyase